VDAVTQVWVGSLGADARWKSKAPQRQTRPDTVMPLEAAAFTPPASHHLQDSDSRKKFIVIDFVINSLSMPSIQTC
jgi:hypothetical protein